VLEGIEQLPSEHVDWYVARGHEWQKAHPAITAVMTGMRRRHGTAATQKAPAVDHELATLATLDGSLRGVSSRRAGSLRSGNACVSRTSALSAARSAQHPLG
jgi:hypothetical protein